MVEITEEMGARVEEVTSEIEERQIQFNSNCQILEGQLEKKDFRIEALEGQVSEYNKRNLFLEKETVALQAATQEQEGLNYDLQQNFDEILADNKTLAQQVQGFISENQDTVRQLQQNLNAQAQKIETYEEHIDFLVTEKNVMAEELNATKKYLSPDSRLENLSDLNYLSEPKAAYTSKSQGDMNLSVTMPSPEGSLPKNSPMNKGHPSNPQPEFQHLQKSLESKNHELAHLHAQLDRINNDYIAYSQNYLTLKIENETLRAQNLST